MRYRIHGWDAASQAPVEPFVVDAADEREARSRASELGTVADRVEVVLRPLTPSGLRELRQIAASSGGRCRVNWPPQEALAVLDRLAALEDEAAALRRRLAALEGVVAAAVQYVGWCDGHGEVEHQKELWGKLRATVEALRKGRAGSA
jgi:hypothetical protein